MNVYSSSFSKSKLRGFTMMELVISMAIMAMLMMTTANIFSSSFSSYQNTRRLENSISDAQFLMNLLAKELRTSTVVSSSSSSVTFFEHSKGQCVQYRFNGGTIEAARSGLGTSLSGCNSFSSDDDFSVLGVGNVSGSFSTITSQPASPGPQRIGRVTITLSIDNGSDPIFIQTTTSLRDYGYAGLQ